MVADGSATLGDTTLTNYATYFAQNNKHINTLVPGMMVILSTCYEIALRCMLRNLIDDQL